MVNLEVQRIVFPSLGSFFLAPCLINFSQLLYFFAINGRQGWRKSLAIFMLSFLQTLEPLQRNYVLLLLDVQFSTHGLSSELLDLL